jgi:ATP-binding cassette subfamily F protein 3
VVIVSHAREFLNVTCNEVIHYFNEKLHYYRGNYDTFEKMRIEGRERNRREVENQQMKLEHMQAFIDKFRYNPFYLDTTPREPRSCRAG